MIEIALSLFIIFLFLFERFLFEIDKITSRLSPAEEVKYGTACEAVSKWRGSLRPVL
jgi:hypothetical protein